MKSPRRLHMNLVLLLMLVPTLFAAPKPSDESITYWVNSVLWDDPRVSSSGISVTTSEGIVTLTGTVRNLVQKQYAEREATKIAGVTGVVNRLIVKPPPRSDIDIRQAIRRRFIASSLLSAEQIGASVESGVVVLSGTVASYSEKEEASLLAGEATGVSGIDNDIMVVYKKQRPDKEIREDIRAKLDRDVYLAGLPVTVTVDRGSVLFTGTVGNAYERNRATDDAYEVPNVSNVVNDLKIAWWEISGTRTGAPTPSDSSLAASVNNELEADLRISEPWEVRVKAEGGHVTLQGTLPSLRQAILARQDAMEVVGVAWVTNRITVNGVWRNDLDLLEDALFSIHSDYALTGDDITAEVNGGTITIRGSVKTPFEKSQAYLDAAGVLGVQNVVNTIAVTGTEPIYSDQSLAAHVKERLAGNGETAPVAGRITVVVNNGAAIISGRVDTWAQYGEAARVASLTVGVRKVDNRITVKGANYQWEKFAAAPPDVLSEPRLVDPWLVLRYNH
ncbi:MAG TPA: BON domain-containing protein [Chitinivibrionales bacterium]|nr:BON domain-containing protein [Chitinivibrionales bacterium]